MLWMVMSIASPGHAGGVADPAEVADLADAVFCGEAGTTEALSNHPELPVQRVELVGVEVYPHLTTFRVDEVLRGELRPGESVVLAHYGLLASDLGLEVPTGIVAFEPGERWLVFARRSAEGWVLFDTENLRTPGRGGLPLAADVACRGPVDEVLAEAAMSLSTDADPERAVLGLSRLGEVEAHGTATVATGERMVEALAGALGRGDEVVPWAALALCARGPLCDVAGARERFLSSRNPRWHRWPARDGAAAALLASLDQVPEGSRPAVILALAGVERPGVVEKLAALSVTDDPPVRDAATLALAWFPGRAEAKAALARAAESPDATRRELAVWGAGLGGMDAPWLQVLAEDPDPEVARAARLVVARGEADGPVAALRDRGLLTADEVDEWVVHAEPDGSWVSALRAALPNPAAWWVLFRDLEARAVAMSEAEKDQALAALEASATGAHRQRALAVLCRKLGREEQARSLEAVLP